MQKIWARPPDKKIELPLNATHQPLGESGQTFIRWLGTFCLCPTYCPLMPLNWTRVPPHHKEDAWIEIQYFELVEGCHIRQDLKGYQLSVNVFDGSINSSRTSKLAKQFGGILHLRIGYLHMVAVSSPDVARQVLQVQDNIFSNRPAHHSHQLPYL
ncbi:cytochrome p450 84a1 [Quercus suber]|uniref:Cytochrome p450 84a1 n=1 Tax=Quercus suber TaxID=58331 RepID=A0AAW0JEW2_QUESU